jgi:hypothetical protein
VVNVLATKTMNPLYLKTKEGKSPFVVLPTNEYEQLLEDLQDLTIIAERKNEETISHQNLIDELKADGCI